MESKMFQIYRYSMSFLAITWTRDAAVDGEFSMDTSLRMQDLSLKSALHIMPLSMSTSVRHSRAVRQSLESLKLTCLTIFLFKGFKKKFLRMELLIQTGSWLLEFQPSMVVSWLHKSATSSAHKKTQLSMQRQLLAGALNRLEWANKTTG